MITKPYQLRVVEERASLGASLQKLNAFIASPAFGDVDAADRQLLVMQQKHMEAYESILSARIELWQGRSEEAAE